MPIKAVRSRLVARVSCRRPTAMLCAGPLCTTAQGFERVREYISSIGKYGPSPLIFSLYGVSELSQAYCRQAAVHGGIYMLRKTAKALVVDKETNEFRGIICNDGWHLKAHHLVVAPEYLVNSVTAAPITYAPSRLLRASSYAITHSLTHSLTHSQWSCSSCLHHRQTPEAHSEC